MKIMFSHFPHYLLDSTLDLRYTINAMKETLPDFKGVSYYIIYDSKFSIFGVSTKPGAVHSGQEVRHLQMVLHHMEFHL